jgi:multidrug efflux pump
VRHANQSSQLTDVYIDGLPEGTRLALNVDREKAEAMSVSFEEINQTLSVTTGSNYVNDYTNNGRVQQVIVQADAPYRMQPEQLLNIPVKNRLGQMVPLSTFVTQSWAVAPQQLNRYQGYPAIRITGSAAPGDPVVLRWQRWKRWQGVYPQALQENGRAAHYRKKSLHLNSRGSLSCRF